MTRLLLTRHGHVDGIKPVGFRGRAELALTETGLAQAEALAARIARQWKPVAVYTSGLQRCVVTGARVAAACGAPASVMDGLMDLDYGAWQMRTDDEVEQESPDALRTVLARHPRETVVMVGHDSVNRALLLQLLDQPLSAFGRLAQDPCTLNEVEIEGETVKVLRINDTSHLP